VACRRGAHRHRPDGDDRKGPPATAGTAGAVIGCHGASHPRGQR
jgi:hypothetical protein